jgi:hypothetical protein
MRNESRVLKPIKQHQKPTKPERRGTHCFLIYLVIIADT